MFYSVQMHSVTDFFEIQYILILSISMKYYFINLISLNLMTKYESMNQLNNIKKLNLEQQREKIDVNYRAIKTTRAITYVFDILILMIAGLYIFNIDFAKWLLIPASGSVLLHSRLSNLYEQQSFLKEQEVIVKHQKK